MRASNSNNRTYKDTVIIKTIEIIVTIVFSCSHLVPCYTVTENRSVVVSNEDRVGQNVLCGLQLNKLHIWYTTVTT